MATHYGEEDLDHLLADFGLPVTIADETVNGLVDSPDEPVLAGVATHAMGAQIKVTIRTNTAPSGLRVGASVIVDCEDFIVRQIGQLGDSAFSAVLCARET